MNPKLSEILQEIEKVVVGKNENVEKITVKFHDEPIM